MIRQARYHASQGWSREVLFGERHHNLTSEPFGRKEATVDEKSFQYWEKRWGTEAIAEDTRAVDLSALSEQQRRNLAILCGPASNARLNEHTGDWEVVEA